MPETFDTATILAPGREILDIFTEYVAACRVLGHHHHDLTRLHEWYDTEDGLDLRAIEGDQRARAPGPPSDRCRAHRHRAAHGGCDTEPVAGQPV